MFCAHCGKEELNQDKFCAQCGQEFHPSGSAEAFFGYSGFWRRFAASTIDTLILSLALFIVILIVVFVMVSLLKTPVDSAGNYEGIINIFSLFMYWLYYAIMESSPRQATFGKKLLKIKITDIHGNRISFGRASGRFFGKIPSGLLLLIGYLMAAFTSKKQALHDMMAGCLVVREDDEGMPGCGIAALVLVAIVPVGILAAVAIPAYQDYTIRAKISEPIIIMMDAQVSIAEFYAQQGSWPVLGTDVVVDTTGSIIANLALTGSGSSATLTATMRETDINSNLASKTIELKTEDGGATWTCLPGTMAARYLPANCR